VLAGTYSVDGSLEIRASGGPRRLDAVLAAVAEARLAPSELQRQADRFVAWFLPVVTGVSAATFAVWITQAPWDRALFNAMAVVLVACPCAAGLATPVAVWGGLARLASFGLVARTGEFLDALARCDFVCLDKTGTLSRETLAVRAWQTEPAFRERETWLKAAVAAAEAGLSHPIATALLRHCHPLNDNAIVAEELRAPAVCHHIDDKGAGSVSGEKNMRDGRGEDHPLVVRARRIEPGLGVVAIMETGNRMVELRVGERALAPAEAGGPAGAGSASEQSAAEKNAGKEVFVFVEGVRAAAIELAETWRDGLGEALAELRALGAGVEVLTGDANAARSLLGAGVSGQQGIRERTHLSRGERPPAAPVIRAGLTPAEKHERVRALVAAGRTVVYLGDGVNDAAAMGAAQASIAMRAGAELARAAAMAVFAGDDLRFLPRAIRVARAARRSIRTNLLFAAAYNSVGMALAAAGLLHPVVAALLMVGSSAFVSVRALRSVGAERSRSPV
jgi:cation transport ATPase